MRCKAQHVFFIHNLHTPEGIDVSYLCRTAVYICLYDNKVNKSAAIASRVLATRPRPPPWLTLSVKLINIIF